MNDIENEIKNIIRSHLTFNYMTNIAGVEGMIKDILALIHQRDFEDWDKIVEKQFEDIDKEIK